MRLPSARKVGVLISGRGSNLMAILAAVQSGSLDAEISVVVSNRAQAGGLDKAAAAGIPTEVLSHGDFSDREAFEAALADVLSGYGVEVVVLAGFMRLLGPSFLSRFEHRVLNIHPSLLPAFPGLNAHEQALAYGTRVSGCTVHFVDEGTDSGPIIDQVVVPVLPDDSVDDLSARILVQEHRVLPRALGWLLTGRLELIQDDGGGRLRVHVHDA
jgi:phosphoribosylglycinamide formyltransferase-1